MSKTMKQLLGIVLMLMLSMVTVSAQEVVVAISDFTGGTVSVKEKNGQEVIINVAPADGYYINTEDVEVIAVMDPASLTRANDESMEPETLPAGVTLTLTLVDDEGNPVVDGMGEPVVDPDDNTAARNYRFTVPEGLGAWVWKAGFHEVDKPVNNGKLTDDVTWEVTTDPEGKTPEVTLTLEGDGSATIDGETTVPWKDFEDQITDIVIGKGIQELGDGLLDGCKALKAITLRGEKFAPLGKNSLTEDVTVDVYGLLYNEYKADEGWGAANITSTGSEAMPGVAFKVNQFDLFVTKEAMLVPSVLNGYTVTAIDGSSVKISPIDDRIIPAGVPVLLFSETVKDDDFRTVTTDQEGTATAGLLKAAGSGGQHVALGGAYLLYNDVFYLSQEGTIPEGGVYIPVSDGKEEQGQGEKKDELRKTRSFLTIGGDNTTAIESFKVQGPSQSANYKDGWFDLSGRRLNSAPTAKGIYVFNGKKMIIR